MVVRKATAMDAVISDEQVAYLEEQHPLQSSYFDGKCWTA